MTYNPTVRKIVEVREGGGMTIFDVFERYIALLEEQQRSKIQLQIDREVNEKKYGKWPSQKAPNVPNKPYNQSRSEP